MANRRELKFASLEDVMPEVERLLRGHKTVGNWSLGQICNHLAIPLRLPVHGYDGPMPPWLVRKVLAPVILRRILQTEKMREGASAPDALQPKPGVDARQEADALRLAIAELLAYHGPVHPHPFFGKMSHDEWVRLSRIHCAHHLSFALPIEAAEAKAG
jgi:hypothetical protein